MEISKEILKGNIDIIILSILKKKDMYGYQISKVIEKKSKEKFTIKEATLYLALKRLEKSNFITSYWSDETTGGGRRKYYKISNDGLNFYEDKREEFYFFHNLMINFFEGA